MRCFAYISEAIVESKSMIPSNLSLIVKASRIKNRKLGVTGFISYREGYYLQIIEGNHDGVELLYQKIKADTRHKNIQVILDTKTSNFFFTHWDMRLVASVNKDPNVLKLFYRYRPILVRLPPEKIALMKIFFQHPMFDNDHSHGEHSTQTFKEYEISMKAWPNFASITPCNEIIEICGYLMRGPMGYQDLLVQCSGIDSKKIDEELGILNNKGLLNYGKKTTGKKSAQPQLSMHSAYNKLKSFLSRIS